MKKLKETNRYDLEANSHWTSNIFNNYNNKPTIMRIKAILAVSYLIVSVIYTTVAVIQGISSALFNYIYY